MPKMVIVQPWFSAVGHPAQSLINTANIIGQKSGILYLISVVSNSANVKLAKDKLQSFGDVLEFPVNTDSVREGTLKALMALKRLIAREPSIERVFFLDAHLVLLAVLWPFYHKTGIKTLGVVYLMGPERVTRYSLLKILIMHFLKREEVVLFLRTEELAEAWRNAFPLAHVKCLPSLELPDDLADFPNLQSPSEVIRFGVLGQIRTGKSLEWLVPMFKRDPTLGELTVAGTFNNMAERRALKVLEDFDGFQDKFLTEEELLQCAASQDYLLMLYDNWDHRMEGAMMFLAARVNRPVIVYDKGWCARMVRTYGNGVLAPADRDGFPAFFKNLPMYGSEEYQQLLDGVSAFKLAHTGETIRNAFLNAISA